MKQNLRAILTIVTGAFLVAAVSSALSFWVCSRMQRTPEPDGHDWIHSQLGLTAEEEKALEPIEQHYHERSRVLDDQMRAANSELAKAILEDGQDSPRVREAITKIHTTMGELQNVAIDHVFEMRGTLTPEQYQKLLHLTADALGNIDSPHAGK
jgi:Spy/CpxP family protein refolding chaperone